jgi:hypothetical protein
VCRYTIGHANLAATVGARPRYGWQIDPFGASALTPEVLSLMGYKALVHHRINQRLTGRFLNVDELQQWSGGMLTSQGMQFDWKFSKSLLPLLTHVMEVAPSSLHPTFMRMTTLPPHLHPFQGGYCSPPGFDFEGDPVQSQSPDPLPNSTNVLNLANSLIQTAVYRQSHTRTSHVLMPMGCDFRWRNASLSFDAIECANYA